MRISIILFFAFLTCFGLNGQSVSIQKTDDVDIINWVNLHFKKGKVPPFSFTYGGIHSSQFITSWKYTSSNLVPTEQGGIGKRVTYTDQITGLVVSCDIWAYPDFNAVEWVVSFCNTSNSNTKEISEVNDSDISFSFPQKGKLNLHYSNGTFPSRSDFAPQLKVFAPNDTFRMRPITGRSSGKVLPFFNLESENSHQGVICAIGWTGEWSAQIQSKENRQLALKSGIPTLKAYLEPGEKIRTSSICLLFWNNKDRFVGHNQFRRLIMSHHTRKVGGKPAIYPYFLGFSWGDPTPCNEYSCMTAKMAKAILERQRMFHLEAEANWLDAGWNEGADRYEDGKKWSNTVGNWGVNKEHFPHGLKEVADEVHALGRKFMVWFEPERVYEGTRWDKEHPDWLLYNANSPNRVFNLGNEDALQWLCKYIGDFIEENGIDYYRQDFNMNPYPNWVNSDKPGRAGLTEIHYIMGLYRYWDYLLNRFPNLLIDNCASGGFRLDWETTLRSAPMWRTDDCYYNDPSDMQCHTYGINLYLPQSGTGFGLPDRTDKYSLRSSMGSSMIYNWKMMTHGENFLKMQECQKEYLKIRPYFWEDYYPLTGTNGHSDAHDNWLSYQFHRPSDNSGFIVAFRHHKNLENSFSVSLHGLKENSTYVLVNEDTGEQIEKTGKQLMNCWSFSLQEVDSSQLFFYKEK